MKQSVAILFASLSICSCAGVAWDEETALDYLISNSMNRGDRVDVDSLRRYTHLAFEEWGSSPWAHEYGREYFKDYILPYCVASEPLEYYWREDAARSYRQYLPADVTDVRQACLLVSESIYFSEDNSFWKEPLQSYSVSSSTLTGKCDDGCIYRAMVMRSLGIPVTMETVPYWGDHNNGHSFNSLILPDGTCVGFNNTVDLRKRLNLQRKIPKIYRHGFEINDKSDLFRYSRSEYIPNELRDFSLYDVTHMYDVTMSELSVTAEHPLPSKLAYLSVFSPIGWRPVAWTKVNGRKMTFKDMGTGYLYDTPVAEAGENIGEGIVYMPVCYDEAGEQLPVDYPYILKRGNVAERLVPDTQNLRSVVLERKFPRKARIIEFADDMIGGYFEVSNAPDFYDSEILHYILDTPLSRMQKIEVNTASKCRYVRYVRPKGGLSIGEMKLRDVDGKELTGRIVADDFIASDNSVLNMCDNDVLTYYSSGNIPAMWIGFEFSRCEHIGSIEFCPRTDDNDISPGDTYELFYWDNDWVSLGCKTATEYSIVFDGVPDNALLWLRDLTEGHEERPFIYEDGQIWY